MGSYRKIKHHIKSATIERSTGTLVNRYNDYNFVYKDALSGGLKMPKQSMIVTPPTIPILIAKPYVPVLLAGIVSEKYNDTATIVIPVATP